MTDTPLNSHRSTLTRALNGGVSTALGPLERMLTRGAGADCRTCFILGPPRSGSTLLYELLVTRFACAYISNFANRLYRVPVAATWLRRGAMRRRTGTFDSRYGMLDDTDAPSEAGRLWRHWMPDAAPYYRDVPGLDDGAIRAKLGGLCRIAGGPAVVKYLHLQSEIPRLVALFPDTVFLCIRRDPIDNARSILRGRREKRGASPTGWWSTHPRGWEAFAEADPMVQSCAQVILCEREIEQSIAAAGWQDRTLTLSYEALCRDPAGPLTEVADFFRARGIALERTHDFPGGFDLSRPARQAEEDAAGRDIAAVFAETQAAIAAGP